MFWRKLYTINSQGKINIFYLLFNISYLGNLVSENYWKIIHGFDILVIGRYLHFVKKRKKNKNKKQALSCSKLSNCSRNHDARRESAE